MKKLIALFLACALMYTLTACSGGGIGPVSTPAATPTAAPNGDSSGNPSDTDSSNLIAYITLSGNTITIDGEGAIVEGNKVSITAAGTYYISGASSNAQIRVYTKGTGTVKLILNGVDITCPVSAPIYIINADKTVITLADGTANYLTDATSYVFENAASDEPDTAIFSNDDLTINGNGSLTVNANYNDGIKSDDDLRITGGVITVNAVDDGIIGRDSLTIKGGDITVNAGGDGMKASNDEDAAEGYISIEGGTIDITAGLDGIQAETNVTISGGDITISSGGGSANASRIHRNRNNTNANSTKGIKAGINVTIEGGAINIDSYDDSIHSNNSLTINGNDILLASGDDGIHADSGIEINGGVISITKCYEGIESQVITIDGGDIHIASSDDGINCRNYRNSPGDKHLYINGGYIVINATGDGIDVNGPIDMTDGIVILNAAMIKPNGAVDYQNHLNVTGGFLIAVGSSTIAKTPSESSTQYSVMLSFTSAQSASTMIHIETEGRKEILTFMPTKEYESVVLCSPELEKGTNYVVYSGGSSTGTVTDGLYSGGAYTAGTQVAGFLISTAVTHVIID